jgi:UDP:flavonoid glycosyltransferase YjiC (YdhE family)
MSVVTEQMTHRFAGEIRADRPMKFLIFPLGYVLAHVGRTVEIAKELRAQGHEVVFAGEDPSHPRSRLSHIVKAGFPVVHVKEPMWYRAWDRFHNYGAVAGVYDFFTSQKWAPLDVILEDIIRVCQEQKPDMIIGDSSIGVSTAGHILGIPAAGVLNAYNTHFFRPWSFYRGLIRAWDWLFLSRIRGRVYRRHGVKQVDAINLLRSITLLSPDLPEFHKPHGGHFPNWHPVGPILSEPPAPLPDWYEELTDGTPNVYITMGSTGLLDPLLRRIYGTFSKLPFRFIVTTGGQAEEGTMAMAPDNFRFATYAPGSKLLQHSTAMIFHGGNGSMYQALSEGVPMVALPSHLEQQVCVSIMRKEGFGIARDARKCTPEDLAKGLRQIIETPSFREKALQYREKVRTARAAAKAADLLVEKAREGMPAGHTLSGGGRDNVLFFPGRFKVEQVPVSAE